MKSFKAIAFALSMLSNPTIASQPGDDYYIPHAMSQLYGPHFVAATEWEEQAVKLYTKYKNDLTAFWQQVRPTENDLDCLIFFGAALKCFGQ